MLRNLLFLISAIIFSCNSASEKKTSDYAGLKKLDWLLGSWKNISDDGQLYEIWTKQNDSTYAGHGYMVANNDTVFSERISLEQRNSDLFYIPVVKQQNEGNPVSFKLVSDKGEFTFENKEHDFPQRVIYKQVGMDSLYARIEGTDKGAFRKEEFSMVRER
jgi:hypothetical protein